MNVWSVAVVVLPLAGDVFQERENLALILEIESGSASGERLDIEQWLAKPDGIAIGEDFAKRHGLKIGDHFRALVNSQIRELTVTFLLSFKDAPMAGAYWAPSIRKP